MHVRMLALALPLLTPAACGTPSAADGGGSVISVGGAAVRLAAAPAVYASTPCAAAAAPSPPLPDAPRGYLEAAGLPPLLRDAALARRARTYALVWLGAYTPPTPGLYGVAVAFQRSGEHIAASPYTVNVSAGSAA